MVPSTRRRFLQSLGGWCSAALAAPGHTAASVRGEDRDPPGVQIASLKDQLERGLTARRAVEFQFIGRVVQLVNQNQLTRAMVLGTYDYVVKKYRNRKYLVPVFELTLRRRVKDHGSNVLNSIPSTM